MRLPGTDVLGLWTDPLGTSLRRWRREGDLVRFRLGPFHPAFLVAHPEQIRHVLHTRRDIYGRDPLHSAALKRVSGSGLTASEGEIWREQRPLLRSGFQRLSRESVAASAAARTDALLLDWRRSAAAGTPVDLSDDMLRLALETIADVVFECDLRERSSAIVSDAAVVLAALYRSMQLPTARTSHLAFALDPRFDRSRQSLYALAAQILARTPRQTGKGSLLATLRHELGPDRAADQVVTMILAGHDTTGAALSWALLLVARHPQITQRLRVEAADAAAEGGVGRADLPLASAVFREALRLYPPAWMLSRSPSVDDEIDGQRIPRGSTVFISPFVTHRHPDYWRQPERFDPERFRDSDRSASYAYLPFGAGPRMCIGRALAETVGQVAISTIACAVELTPLPACREVTARARLTLHPAPRPLVAVCPL